MGLQRGPGKSIFQKIPGDSDDQTDSSRLRGTPSSLRLLGPAVRGHHHHHRCAQSEARQTTAARAFLPSVPSVKATGERGQQERWQDPFKQTVGYMGRKKEEEIPQLMGRMENAFGHRDVPAILKIPSDLQPLRTTCKSTHVSQTTACVLETALKHFPVKSSAPFFFKSQDPNPPGRSRGRQVTAEE